MVDSFNSLRFGVYSKISGCLKIKELFSIQCCVAPEMYNKMPFFSS